MTSAKMVQNALSTPATARVDAIYRRWPYRAALAVAAYRLLVAADSPLPDTGELQDDPDLRAELQERATTGATGTWLAILERAVARGEALPAALHPRVATVPIVLLRNEYITRGICPVPDDVIVEIMDEVYLPLVRGRGLPASY